MIKGLNGFSQNKGTTNKNEVTEEFQFYSEDQVDLMITSR